jgi:hypothetical protein
MLLVILKGAAFGYDESVYASETRSFVTGTPAFWHIFRPPGLPIAGLAAVPFGLSDVSLRVVAATGALLLFGLAWSLARLMWGGLAGGIALVAIIVSPVVLNEIVLFHNDVPSAAAVVALMALLWWQLEVRERPSAMLIAAGPLAATAFYLRYGALALLAGIALAAILLWGGRLLREARVVGATAVVTLALFLPHVVDAVIRTGSPVGIVRAAVAQVDTTTPIRSALQYLQWLPARLAGVAGVVLVIAAALAVVHAGFESIRDRGPTVSARRLIWLLVPAAVAFLGTVMVSHAEARYVLTPVVIVEIAGAGSAASAIAWLTIRSARARPGAARPIMAAILIGLMIVLAVNGRSWLRVNLRQPADQWLLDAGRAVATDARGPCTLVSSLLPILGWYSGCTPVQFNDPADARTSAAAGRSVYVVFTSLDVSRVESRALARYRSELNLVEIARMGHGSRIATVYRVQP